MRTRGQVRVVPVTFFPPCQVQTVLILLPHTKILSRRLVVVVDVAAVVDVDDIKLLFSVAFRPTEVEKKEGESGSRALGRIKF